jgi:hypothetical protein
MKKYILVAIMFIFTSIVVSANSTKTADSVVSKVNNSISVVSVIKPGTEMPELLLVKDGHPVTQYDTPYFDVRVMILISFTIAFYLVVLVYKLLNKKSYPKKRKLKDFLLIR